MSAQGAVHLTRTIRKLGVMFLTAKSKMKNRAYNHGW